MLTLQNISYLLPNGQMLLNNIHLHLRKHDKSALIGNNGAGKSTLLQIISGTLLPSGGQALVDSTPYVVPQIFGQYHHLTVAQALQVDQKINALNEILEGNVNEINLDILADDWTIENRLTEALAYWHLHDLKLDQSMATLSGGQKTKVFLAGILVHRPELVLLDEPSNHLDSAARKLLYHFLKHTTSTVLVVSHDKTLLNQLPTTIELDQHGATVYHGNYDFYTREKQLAYRVLNASLQEKEKTLRKAREKERATIERQKKLDARGKQKQEKAGVSRIMMNTLRNNAEKSTARVKDIHSEKITGIAQELRNLREEIPDLDKMKFGLANTKLHQGKVLFKLNEVNFNYAEHHLWQKNLNFQILSGERVAIKGANGSGKTTLTNLLLGKLMPTKGEIFKAKATAVFVNQDYSLIDNQLTVYEQAQEFNNGFLQEHEVKIRLHRFLFRNEDWIKPCLVLSGGEKMKLMLCCLTMIADAPDVIFLDEPTNNLDLQNIEILSTAIREYQGTLMVISHDEHFLTSVQIERVIYL